MIKVITYGTFDLFHEGHYNILKRAKEQGDYLIVGITSENYDKTRGKLNVKQSLIERIENVKKSGFADKIIVEEYMGQKIEDIKKYNVDKFVIGSDWIGKFDYLNEYCKVIYVERTKGISSTELRDKERGILKIGCVGAGRIAKRMIQESKYVSGINFDYLYGNHEEKLKKFVEENDLKYYSTNYENFLKEVDAGMTEYKVTESSRLIQDFTDELSNWYVRRCRERFWGSGMEQDKINAYMTLYTCLVTLAKISAPFVPFMTEEIYQNLVTNLDKTAPESIHLCDFPVADESMIDSKLEENMEKVLEIVTLGRACRNVSNMKNRQVLSKVYVGTKKTLDEDYYYIIREELNVKEIEFLEDVSEFVSYNVKPNLKTVGPKYGSILPTINQMLRGGNGTAFVKELKTNGSVILEIGDAKVELKEEDLLIETAKSEKYISATEGEMTVVLDIELTPELIEEGFVRELISKIQNLRKESGFEVQNHIEIYYSDNKKIAEIIEKNKEQIAEETLADLVTEGKGENELDINGEKVNIKLIRK